MTGPLCSLSVTVRLHGRHAEAHGAVRQLHKGGDRPQASGGHDSARHQPVLLSLLHVQGRPGPLRQCEYAQFSLAAVPTVTNCLEQVQRILLCGRGFGLVGGDVLYGTFCLLFDAKDFRRKGSL